MNRRQLLSSAAAAVTVFALPSSLCALPASMPITDAELIDGAIEIVASYWKTPAAQAQALGLQRESGESVDDLRFAVHILATGERNNLAWSRILAWHNLRHSLDQKVGGHSIVAHNHWLNRTQLLPGYSAADLLLTGGMADMHAVQRAIDHS